MKGFNLSKNYLDDLEVLLRNTRAKLKKVLVVVLKDSQIRRSLTPEFEAVANKSLHEFSAPTIANIRTRPEVNVGTIDLSSSLHSLPWCKLISFVQRLMKMQVHTYNTF
jgi:hypothetical protein